MHHWKEKVKVLQYDARAPMSKVGDAAPVCVRQRDAVLASDFEIPAISSARIPRPDVYTLR